MELNFKTFGAGYPIIILHGLLGSLDNWQGIAKRLAASQFQVYIIDQRNHGRSPHTEEFNYDLLSADLLEFYEQHGIAKAHLIGHSMGGKVAMEFALQHAEKVEKLVVVDIAPVNYEDQHSAIFKALFAADVQHADSREAVEKALRDNLDESETTIQFLLKGLNRDDAGAHFEWKFALEELWKNYNYIAAAIKPGRPFEGKTLFIKGQKSNYIAADNFHEIDMLFPNNSITEIEGAGHWVHADKPEQFLEGVEGFLKLA